MVSDLTNTMLGHWQVIIDPDKKNSNGFYIILH